MQGVFRGTHAIVFFVFRGMFRDYFLSAVLYTLWLAERVQPKNNFETHYRSAALRNVPPNYMFRACSAERFARAGVIARLLNDIYY